MEEKSYRKSGKSPGRSQYPNGGLAYKQKDYTSEGVRDSDIFKLPGSDWQLLGVLTVIAAIVRLFRIYQPTSVVFDEVQYEINHHNLFDTVADADYDYV